MALHVGATVNFPEEPETAARRPARDRAPRDDRAAAVLGGDVLGVPGEDRRRRIHEAAGHAGRAGRSGARAAAPGGWPRAPRRRRAGAAALARPPRVPRPARQARALPRPVRVYRRRRRSARRSSRSSAPIGLNLKQVYGQTETAGICVRPPGRRRARRDGGQADPRDAGADLGERRDSRRERERVPGLLQESRRPPRRRSTTAGSAPATPGSSSDDGHLV